MTAFVGTKNFSVAEANGAGDTIPPQYYANAQATLDLLQRVRDILGVPLFITSFYRTPEHNASVNGVPHSGHLEARAADVRVLALSMRDVAQKLNGQRIPGLGQVIFYPTTTGHIHFSTGDKSQWLVKLADGGYSNFTLAQIPEHAKGDLPPVARALASSRGATVLLGLVAVALSAHLS